MTGRSAAVPFELRYFAIEGSRATNHLEGSIAPLFSAYDNFLRRCVPTLEPLPLLPVLVSTLRSIDQFALTVAEEFSNADNAALINGTLDRLTFALETRDVEAPNLPPLTLHVYDPFAGIRYDPRAAAAAGWLSCIRSSDDQHSYVLVGPDGQNYYLANTAENPAFEADWQTVWMQQGTAQGDDVDQTIRFAYAFSGMPDPFGTPAPADWYETQFRVDPNGNPVIGVSAPSAYLSTTTPLDDPPTTRTPGTERDPLQAQRSRTATRLTTGANLVAVADTLTAAVDAYQRSGNLNQGYYAIRLQQNSVGQRRAIITVFQQRGDRTDQADVTDPRNIPRLRRPVATAAEPTETMEAPRTTERQN